VIAQLGVVEVHPGLVKRHTGEEEVHPGMIEVHLEGVDIILVL
jgi:hypothetical protein